MPDTRPDGDLETMRTRLATEVTWRFGAERARALAGEIEALAADLARVAATAVPEDTEPGFFLLDRGGR
jgi:hypothetical protein